MRLIFIRHAEPDYEHNTLTRKGFREAELLAPRAAGWNASRYFTSPLNRAKLTAAPALSLLGKEAEIVPWMQEFSYMVKDPVTGRVGVPWDFMPSYWTEQEELHDRHHFYRHPVLSSNPAYEPAVIALRKGLDGILSGYGLTRCGDYYRHDPAVDCDVTLAFFAHLGANCEALGYLLGISPLVRAVHRRHFAPYFFRRARLHDGVVFGEHPAGDSPEKGYFTLNLHNESVRRHL